MPFYTFSSNVIIYDVNSVKFILKIILIYIINLINTIKTSEYDII